MTLLEQQSAVMVWILIINLYMLAKIAPRFVIQGVIQNAYYANYMDIDISKQLLG
jgi:hypothetical protein